MSEWWVVLPILAFAWSLCSLFAHLWKNPPM